MKKQTLLALALGTIIVAASADPVMAYVLLSPRRRWATTPVTVRVYNVGNSTITDGDGGVSRTVTAIRVWGMISSSTTSSAAVRGTAPATIMLNSNGGGLCTGGCLAATLTGYYTTQTGDDRIYDADVYTNTAQPLYSSGEPCSGEYDVEGIMAHEVGHVIGIGHSTVAGATMYPSVSACNTANRTLAADDIAAKNDLY